MKKLLKKYKIRLKYKFSNKKLKPMHLIILCCAIIFFTFGYSLLSTQVGVSGLASFLAPPPTLASADNLGFRDEGYIDKIKTITFNNSINNDHGAEKTWDLSEKQDGSILGYVIYNDMDYLYYDLHIQANGNIMANEDSSYLFAYMENLESINNIEYLKTENVKDMSHMFSSDTLLETLDVSSFDTSNVTDMNSMFLSCGSLSEIDVSNFNTEKVTDMNQMFYECVNITSLDLDEFDTSQVTNMYGMFCMCEVLETLDLSSFDTSKVNNLYSMFDACMSLTSVNLSSFNTSNVQYCSYMFSWCTALTSLDLSNFDLSLAEEMEGMFDEVSCSVKIPPTTGSISNTITKYYGKTTDVYAEGTFILFVSLNSFITKAKAGNATSSDVGTTFTVNLGSTYGEHTLRVTNVSTPTACSGANFSQSACGVVLEFADIITNQQININSTNVGGWPASSIRTFVNNDIYNALPSNLKSATINTTVVSGHGSTTGETNFTSTDKLYLLSAHEVWVDGTSNKLSSYDTSYNNTRQLDYYAGKNVTTNSCSDAIKKYNGSATFWWIRSAYSNNSSSFFRVRSDGVWYYNGALSSYGVSPAFRIA